MRDQPKRGQRAATHNEGKGHAAMHNKQQASSKMTQGRGSKKPSGPDFNQSHPTGHCRTGK